MSDYLYVYAWENVKVSLSFTIMKNKANIRCQGNRKINIHMQGLKV